jgi:NOL1/NOP2/fmu family ribosome biogenesis protein
VTDGTDVTGDGDMPAGAPTNDGQRFDRLPPTAAERVVEGRATRREVIEWWVERFGLDRATFDGHTVWEKGAGKVWAFAADVESPAALEGLGMTFLRTRQEHWKPTTDAVQRFGRDATRNVVVLDDADATAFLAGETTEPGWDGDWGYLIAAHRIAGEVEPIGVGLYVHDEFRSQMPKGRRREP